MSSSCLKLLVVAALGLWPALAQARELRVCAEPRNLPFSNTAQEGFENRIARLVADDLKADLANVWLIERRAFIRNGLAAKACDVVIGMPKALSSVRTTRPYYRSTFMLLTRQDSPAVKDLADPALQAMKIGVQMSGDDGGGTPPSYMLANLGLADRLRGFPMYDDYTGENRPARIIDALSAGDIDAAAVWGPLAGYFAPRASTPLRAVALQGPAAGPMQMSFDIAMAVRKDDVALAQELDDVIARRGSDIDAILRDYRVPMLPLHGGTP
jgi:mxaJ protein